MPKMDKQNYEELRIDVKDKIKNLYKEIEDKYCDGCHYLNDVIPPARGATGCDINPWRDSYKCQCRYFNVAWLSGKRNQIHRCMECVIDGTKEKVNKNEKQNL